MIPLAAYGAHTYLGKRDNNALKRLLAKHQALVVQQELIGLEVRSLENQVCNLLNLCGRCGNKKNYSTIKCDHKGG